MFQKVRLETGSGCFVQNGMIPQFRPAAEIVFWGDRVFKFHVGLEDDTLIYREAFAVAMVIEEKENG